MVPFILQVIATAVVRVLGRPWRDANWLGLGIMFLFTGASHFSSLKHDLAAMIPPPFTGALLLIYVTGLLQIAGAIGLMAARTRRWAAWCLAAMLVGLFPANVYAAINGLTLGNAGASSLWVRAPLQLFWIMLLVREATSSKVSFLTASPRSATNGSAPVADRPAKL
jgi:uncharacterized membrane protein